LNLSCNRKPRVERHVHDHAGSDLLRCYQASQHKQPPTFNEEAIVYPKLGHVAHPFRRHHPSGTQTLTGSYRQWQLTVKMTLTARSA
jgi:hypothetical protein